MNKKKTNSQNDLQSIVEQCDPYTIHHAAMRGLRVQKFYKLVKQSELEEKELATLIGCTPSILKKYQQKRKLIKGTTAERLIILDILYQYGRIVFQSSFNFNQWLSSPYTLSNRIAKEYLRSHVGINKLMKELYCISMRCPFEADF